MTTLHCGVKIRDLTSRTKEGATYVPQDKHDLGLRRWSPAIAVVVGAQTALGTLRGAVLDEQGGALPGVTITLRHLETNTVQTSVSSGDGKYFVPNLRPGAYELLSELSGFTPSVRPWSCAWVRT